MTAWGILCAVVMAFAILTAPAYAKTAKKKIHQVQLEQTAFSATALGSDSNLVAKARQYVGMNARQIGLHRYTLWCSAFLRFIAGSPRGVDDRAISWMNQQRDSARVGAIVILQSVRQHVGVVSGFDPRGNPIVISGNHNNRVAEAVYPRRSVIAYVVPPA